MSFKLKIVSQDGVCFEDEILKLNIMTSEGELTILSHHIPLLVTLKKPAKMKIFTKNEVKSFIGGDGFLSVKEDETSVVVDNIE